MPALVSDKLGAFSMQHSAAGPCTDYSLQYALCLALTEKSGTGRCGVVVVTKGCTVRKLFVSYLFLTLSAFCPGWF